jgi:cytochrome P450
MRFRSSLPLHGRAAHPEGAAVSGTGSSEAQRLAERFDPFHDPYLADPYPFFAESRAATPVFYSPDLEYWVVTRYHDIRQIFQTPTLFSAANTLAPLQPICPAAGHLLAEGGFRPVPTLTNSDPPGHTRVRRLANVAFTPRRVTAMEPFVRELTARFLEARLSSGRADEEMCGDPARIPNAIEEVLRFDSSVIAWRRQTTQAVEIGGVPVPADANLLLLLGSANRDPAVFEDPDHFDIHRQNAKEHLSLGSGVHFCLGAPLARLEARVVLEELSARLPSLRLVPGQTLRFQPNTTFRGPLALLVEWDT